MNIYLQSFPSQYEGMYHFVNMERIALIGNMPAPPEAPDATLRSMLSVAGIVVASTDADNVDIPDNFVQGFSLLSKIVFINKKQTMTRQEAPQPYSVWIDPEKVDAYIVVNTPYKFNNDYYERYDVAIGAAIVQVYFKDNPFA